MVVVGPRPLADAVKDPLVPLEAQSVAPLQAWLDAHHEILVGVVLVERHKLNLRPPQLIKRHLCRRMVSRFLARGNVRGYVQRPVSLARARRAI